MTTITPEIFNAINSAPDADVVINAFAVGFGLTPDEMRALYQAELDATMRTDNVIKLIGTITNYSIPKTVARLAEQAGALGCTIRLAWVDGDAKMTIVDPMAKRSASKSKGKSNRRYFVDGKPLFDTYKSIKDAMVKLGGFDNVVPAIGPGNAHKMDAERYSSKTSLNAWQALIAFGTDAQKARITRIEG